MRLPVRGTGAARDRRMTFDAASTIALPAHSPAPSVSVWGDGDDDDDASSVSSPLATERRVLRNVSIELCDATLRGGTVHECDALIWLERCETPARRMHGDVNAMLSESTVDAVVVEGSARRCAALSHGAKATAHPRWVATRGRSVRAQSRRALRREREQRRQQSELVWHVGTAVPLVLCIELSSASRSVGWTRVPLPERGIALQGKCSLKLSADDHTRKHATALTLRLFVGSGVAPVAVESPIAELGGDREFSDLLQAMHETRATGGRASSDGGSAVATSGTPMHEHEGGVRGVEGAGCPALYTRLFEEAEVWRRERATERDAIHSQLCTFKPRLLDSESPVRGDNHGQGGAAAKLSGRPRVEERLIAAGESLSKKKAELADSHLASLRGNKPAAQFTAREVAEQVRRRVSLACLLPRSCTLGRCSRTHAPSSFLPSFLLTFRPPFRSWRAWRRGQKRARSTSLRRSSSALTVIRGSARFSPRRTRRYRRRTRSPPSKRTSVAKRGPSL